MSMGSLESLVTIASPFASAFFAWLSYRSAKSQSVERQKEKVKDIHRQILQDVNDISVVGQTCLDLIEKSKVSYQTLFSLSGMTGSTRLTLLIEKLTEQKVRVSKIISSSGSIANSILPSSIGGEVEARDVQVRLRKLFIELQALVRSVEGERRETEDQIGPLRANVLSR